MPYHPDLLPDHGLAHARLTASLVTAWIFGGMGSWNDIGFDDPAVHATYLSVTKDLFDSVVTAADAVTNVRV